MSNIRHIAAPLCNRDGSRGFADVIISICRGAEAGDADGEINENMHLKNKTKKNTLWRADRCF